VKAYGAYRLTATSPSQSFTEPIPLSEAKEFLRVTNTNQDLTIAGMIRAARSRAEKEQQRDLVTKQLDFTLDAFAGFEEARSCYLVGTCGEIQLRGPLQSVDLVQYTDSDGADTVLTESTDYVVDLARDLILPAYGKSWPFFTPAVSSAVLIRITTGLASTDPFWQDTGADVLIGMKMLITAWYQDRIPYMEGTGLVEVPYGITTLLRRGALTRAF